MSASLTDAATTVTVHDSLASKSASGSSVKPLGPPVTAAVWAPLVAQLMVYQSATLTGSLKVTVIGAASATPVAPFVGVVEATVGA